MVSWLTHRCIAELLCGYAERGIDGLIDEDVNHDLFCKDEETRMKLAYEILRRYGEKGVCHALTHCIADAIVEIVPHVFCDLLKDAFDVEEAYEKLRAVIADKALSLLEELIRPLDGFGLIRELRDSLVVLTPCLLLYAALDVRGFSKRLRRKGVDRHILDLIVRLAFEDCMANIVGVRG